MKNLKKLILDKLSKSPNLQMSLHDLKQLCGHNPKFKAAITELILSEQIHRLKAHRIQLNESENSPKIIGKLHLNARGFGFVTPEEPTELNEDIFIPASRINGAMNGDIVQVKIDAIFTQKNTHGHRAGKTQAMTNDCKGPSGEIIEIVKQGFETTVGKLYVNNKKAYLIPLRRELPDSIPLAAANRQDNLAALNNHWVKVKLLRNKSQFECQIAEDISPEDSILGDLHAVIAEFKLQPPYDPELEQEAAALQPYPVPNRVDLRHLNPVTIDPADAKDFDDAISISEGEYPDTVTIGVHIADVAAYIRPDSFLDREAAKRCFTAYLPGMTLPMLPHPLAAVQCSLISGEERLAHTVLLQVNPKTGEIKGYKRCRSLIKVLHRLTHEETDFFFETGTIPATWPENLYKIVSELNALAGILRRNRKKEEQFLEIEIPETRILTQGMPPEIVGLKQKHNSIASELVEEYMLAANSAVGKELIEKQIPAVYRVHDGPTEEDLALFCKNVRDTYRISIPKLATRSDINQFMKSMRDNELFELLSTTLLGCLSRAKYAPKPSLHYGLGKHIYCHFTSPIRRYSDTLVHQQLLAHDCQLPLRSFETISQFANQITEKEKINDTAYFTAVDRVKLRYLAMTSQQRSTRMHDGIIAKIIGNNLLIYLPELSIYGKLPLHLLTDDFYSVRDNEIVGRRSHRRIRCGDIIQVCVNQTDFIRGTLELNLDIPKRKRKK